MSSFHFLPLESIPPRQYSAYCVDGEYPHKIYDVKSRDMVGSWTASSNKHSLLIFAISVIDILCHFLSEIRAAVTG